MALPGPRALEWLGRLRSPAWALAGPGALLVGTFGVLALPPLALAMVALDVLLLATGVGQPAAALVSDAMGSTDRPVFDHAQLGSVSTDYPDLVLAAVLGGIVAGRAIQQPAAVLVAILAAAYGGFLAFADMLPATVPLLLALLLVEWTSARPAHPRRSDLSRR